MFNSLDIYNFQEIYWKDSFKIDLENSEWYWEVKKSLSFMNDLNNFCDNYLQFRSPNNYEVLQLLKQVRRDILAWSN